MYFYTIHFHQCISYNEMLCPSPHNITVSVLHHIAHQNQSVVIISTNQKSETNLALSELWPLVGAPFIAFPEGPLNATMGEYRR